MTDKAICDSACLIGLDGIDRLDLLEKVFSSVTVPTEVQAEFGELPSWIVVTDVSNRPLVAALSTQLGAGESGAIALAYELLGGLIVLDDRKARRIAQQLGLKFIGTVGVILRAKRLGHILEVRSILDALLAVDFRMSSSLYDEAVRLAGEAHLK